MNRPTPKSKIEFAFIYSHLVPMYQYLSKSLTELIEETRQIHCDGLMTTPGTYDSSLRHIAYYREKFIIDTDDRKNGFSRVLYES